jgi:SAM-dependent methyltransferase
MGEQVHAGTLQDDLLIFSLSKKVSASVPAKKNRNYRYLLGDTRTEAARLRAQARLWDPVALALFDRLKVRRRWKVLEIGPGQGSLHLELRRRVQGPIDAVEPSAAFSARLRTLCGRDGFGRGRLWQTTLAEAELPDRHYDLIFVRWVFLFLPDPEAHVRKLAAALKPGGILAIEDYLRETFSMVPKPKEWPAFIAADRAFFASQGGHASIGGHLPQLYQKAGLDVIDITPNFKSGGPGSPVWNWISSYFFGVMDQLAEFPPFTPSDASRLRRHWITAAKEKTSLLVAPVVLDVVGRKRRRRAV